jgi:nucleoside-diphosphate-sugar epimerase
MRVLVTGHNGYIGAVMMPVLAAAGHDVVGFDSDLFQECGFGTALPRGPAVTADIRDIEISHLAGFDAVVHLAAISNDPLGNLNPQVTYDINHLASVRLARLAKQAGVRRFLFASSCSLYGLAAGDALLQEDAPFNPITPYGRSKVLVERDVAALADDNFSPVFLRNATAYGVSSRLRADIVVNSLVGYAVTTGQILIQSDGTPWRPLVHIEDISAAFVAVLEAPTELIHREAFNVGQSAENYRVSEIADLVLSVVPGCSVQYAEGGGPDPRCYRVDCSKLSETLPSFRPSWTVRHGVRQLYEAYSRHGLTYDEFAGEHSRYLRIRHIQRLQQAGRLDLDLRWTPDAAADQAAVALSEWGAR